MPTDEQKLEAFIEFLQGYTDNSKRSHGWCYDDEIALLKKLKQELHDLRRHAVNLYQDSCEGALVQISYVDAMRQALAEVAPDHPALKGLPPSFGVWETQRKEIETLTSRLSRFETTARDFVAKVDSGRARSVDSYNKFVEALKP